MPNEYISNNDKIYLQDIEFPFLFSLAEILLLLFPKLLKEPAIVELKKQGNAF